MSNDFVTYLRALAEKHPRTVRSAARMRQPLDGADAQALEGALCSTERERDEARAEVERLHKAHQAACEGGDFLRAEVERLKEEPALLRAALINLCNVSRVALEDAYGRARNSKLKGEEK